MDNGIDITDVAFRIGKFSMESLSVNIRKGEYFVLTGPNGSGKTLLIKLIAGLYRPLAGDITVFDRPVGHLPPWRRNIGYVPQDGILFPNRNVRRNIEFGLEVRRMPKERIKTEVDKIVSMMNLSHLLDRMPQGLSGGERQKVSLARAMVFQPSILLLDEPVSAIDEDTRDGLCMELRQIQRDTGITTLHVSHNRHETELVADRVGVLVKGTLKEIHEV